MIKAPARGRGRRAGLDVNMGRAELALAYELRQEGVRVKLIASNFGCNQHRLYTLLARCENEGLGWLLKP